MTALDLDRIEALAKAATPGPWRSIASPVEKSKRYRCVVFGKAKDELYDTSALLAEDARLIAALDPSTVLALVGRARMAEELEHGAAYHTYEQGFKDGQHSATKDRNSIP